MLSHINISNFAIIEALELDFQKGLTCMTGETGAGKSILLDALSLCLGARADTSMLKNKAERADIFVQFDLEAHPLAKSWLNDRDLLENDDCIIRRTISPEGRSKASINGRPATVSQIKELGALLVQLHGQHAHYSLLQPEMQRIMLDSYAQNTDLMQSVKTHFLAWKGASTRLEEARATLAQYEAQKTLLSYQIEEMTRFAPEEHEYQELEQEHRKQAHSQHLIEQYDKTLLILRDHPEHNVQSMLYRIVQDLETLQDIEPQLKPTLEMLQQAVINLQESSSDIEQLLSECDIDPGKLEHLEQRLARFHELARKHQVQPESIFNHFDHLKAQWTALETKQDDIATLEEAIQTHFTAYQTAALDVSQARQLASEQLSQEISASLKQLNMPQAKFQIDTIFDAHKISLHGSDEVIFKLSSNHGQTVQPIKKVASGGELSRISLILQVLASQKTAAPTLIFDEVDTGISGATAQVVGQLLRQLAQHTQTLCITHLPQVAGLGHHHLLVKKEHTKGQTKTQLKMLSLSERQHELARLLAGNTITESALDNAKQLLHTS